MTEPAAIDDHKKPEPVFNVPAVIMILLVSILLVHAVRTNFISQSANIWLLVNFAFIPVRYSEGFAPVWQQMPAIWSPLTYSFLHGDWTHVIVNSIWFLAFGAVVAKRLKVLRFLLLCATGSVLGACAHYPFNQGSVVPMIGASAVVSACMGAAVRFAFPKGGRFSHNTHALPAQSLFEALSNRQVLIFTGVWFAINLVFGLGGEIVAGEGQSIAWQAHVGGFLSGLLLFAVFDKQPEFTNDDGSF